MNQPTLFWKLYWAAFRCGALLLLVTVVRRKWSQAALMVPALAAAIRFGWRDPSGFKIVATAEGDVDPER